MVRTIGAIGRGDDNVIDIIPTIIARRLKVGRRYKTDLACIGINREQGRIRPGQAIDQRIAIRIRRRRLIGCGLVLLRVGWPSPLEVVHFES